MPNQHTGKARCKFGHPFTTENTQLAKGVRFCRICRANRRAAQEAKAVAARRGATHDLTCRHCASQFTIVGLLPTRVPVLCPGCRSDAIPRNGRITASFQIEPDLWSRLGEAHPHARAAVLREFVRWYLREPGAVCPRQPSTRQRGPAEGTHLPT